MAEDLGVQANKMAIALFILLLVFVVILHWFTLIYIDDLKSRIDRRVDEDKWQNEYIERLMERVYKLENKDDV